MRLTENQKGDLSIMARNLLWGLFPVITVLIYTSLEPLMTLAFSTAFAVLFFIIILSASKKWFELRQPGVWLDIALISLFIGVLFYSFFFFGLKYTSPGNASLIAICLCSGNQSLAGVSANQWLLAFWLE